MIVERTEYYAKPGQVAEVLAVRQRACAVRRELGLSSGRVYLRHATSGAEGPDVVWECTFPSLAAQQADLAARGDSPAFAAVRQAMDACIDRFARHVSESDPTPLPNGMRETAIDGLPIVPREIVFRSGDLDLKGYLFVPPGEGPFPCLVTNHGSGIDKGSLDVSRPGTAALYMSWGIASFLPHRRGYGESPGRHWREEITAEYGTEDYDAQIATRLDAESEDVLAALDCVSALPEIRADHVGVIGSSFGGTNTLLAASKTNRFTCAVDFAGAAMNWDRTPRLRDLMIAAARRVTMPIAFIQAQNDYSIRPTQELPEALEGTGKIVWSKIYPAFGINAHEGHLLESRGAQLWAPDVHRFLERYL